MFLFGVSPRIALQEETNRMSANALAIVFAPCILRCHDTIDPLLSVQDIGKTTAYVLLCALQSHIQLILTWVVLSQIVCCHFAPPGNYYRFVLFWGFFVFFHRHFFCLLNGELQTEGKDSKYNKLSHINQMPTTMFIP